jgi:hypothetical protein
VGVRDHDAVHKKYDEFLRNIRPQVIDHGGSIRIFLTGDAADVIGGGYDELVPRPYGQDYDPSTDIFKKRVHKPDVKGRIEIGYFLKQDRGTEIATVWGHGKAIIKAEIIIQGDVGKDLSDPNCGVKVKVKTYFIKYGIEQSDTKGRKRSSLLLDFDLKDRILKHKGKVIDAINTEEISEKIMEELSNIGGTDD